MEVSDVVVELYGLAPEEFVAARAAAAKQLRTAGDRVGAQTVGKLRRPSVNQWALNMVARTEPELTGQWVDAAKSVRAAQESAAAGEANDLRAALGAARQLTVAVRAAAAPWSTRDDLTLLISDIVASPADTAAFGAGVLGSDHAATAPDGAVPAAAQSRARPSRSKSPVESPAEPQPSRPRGLDIAEAELGQALANLERAAASAADAIAADEAAEADEQAAAAAVIAARLELEKSEAAHATATRDRREVAKAREAAARQLSRAQRGLDNATARVERLRAG